MARRILVVGCGLATAACSLLTDLGGYTGGPGSSSATGSDASADGSVAPDGAAPDAGVDASGSFCTQGAHAFCDDFEQGALLDRWDEKSNDARGSEAIVTDRAAGGLRSFLAKSTRLGSSDQLLFADIAKTLPGARKTVVEFDVYIVAPDWQQGDINGGIMTFYFGQQTGDALGSYSFTYGPTYTTLGAPNGLNSGPALVTDTWMHAKMIFDPAGSADVTVGPAHITASYPALNTNVVGPKAVLILGVEGYNKPAPGFTFYYDNVTIDTP